MNELAARLPERVLRQYQAYADVWMLPTRRLQLQLAKIAQTIDARSGAHEEGTDLPLSDYLFDPIEPDPVRDAREAFGFKPINLKKKESG